MGGRNWNKQTISPTAPPPSPPTPIPQKGNVEQHWRDAGQSPLSWVPRKYSPAWIWFFDTGAFSLEVHEGRLLLELLETPMKAQMD